MNDGPEQNEGWAESLVREVEDISEEEVGYDEQRVDWTRRLR